MKKSHAFKIALLALVVAIPLFYGFRLVTQSSTGDNFAQCVINNIPDASNESIRRITNAKCFEAHPAGMGEIDQGAGLGAFSKWSNQSECIASANKKTVLHSAEIQVNRSCYCLYAPPNFPGQKCA